MKEPQVATNAPEGRLYAGNQWPITFHNYATSLTGKSYPGGEKGGARKVKESGGEM